MADVVKARHVITGITVEIPVEQFKAMAFTPLHANYEVLSADSPVDCIPCGKTVGDADETTDQGAVEVDLDDDYYYDDPDEGEDNQCLSGAAL